MNQSLLRHLESRLSISLKAVSAVSGGDISQAYKLEASNQTYFAKVSSGPEAVDMYRAEAKGLRQLATTKTIKTPEVISDGEFMGTAYLIMHFVESKRPTSQEFEKLGRQLAALHLSGEYGFFGNDHDNFIGSLAQSNKQKENWANFYAHERIWPQIELALNKGLLTPQQLPNGEFIQEQCESLFGNARPSLLHGDLWGGNYLISTDGVPYLIDPAVYVGHSEVDLAMTKLFGGFGSTFYSAYHEIIPPHENQTELTEIYQLYYLLVHLNLFGRSYFEPVIRIVKKYFL